MALYVRNELDEGTLPGGKRFVSAPNLLARRAQNVPTGEDSLYGMGLEDDSDKGVSVIQHGGSLFGYKSNWFAVPAARVGVVVLTNSDTGYTLANGVKRRLLELLYDGKPEAAENVASAAKRADQDLAKLRSEVDPHHAATGQGVSGQLRQRRPRAAHHRVRGRQADGARDLDLVGGSAQAQQGREHVAHHPVAGLHRHEPSGRDPARADRPSS